MKMEFETDEETGAEWSQNPKYIICTPRKPVPYPPLPVYTTPMGQKFTIDGRAMWARICKETDAQTAEYLKRIERAGVQPHPNAVPELGERMLASPKSVVDLYSERHSPKAQSVGVGENDARDSDGFGGLIDLYTERMKKYERMRR